MVDKINQMPSVQKARLVKTLKESQNKHIKNNPSEEGLSGLSLLEQGIRPSKKLKLIVEEQGLDVARKQLIREILLDKFGQDLIGSSEFERSLEKLSQRIESIPELKNEYDTYLSNI